MLDGLQVDPGWAAAIGAALLRRGDPLGLALAAQVPQANSRRTLDAAVLTRCLRRPRPGERRPVLGALSGEVSDSGRASATVRVVRWALCSARRRPFGTEGASWA